MAQHTHDVYDTGKYFEINGISRFIQETSATKLVLVQGDHNSEVITFQMPRYIDGHDMLLCNKIRVHYINLDTKTNDKSADIYEVTDLALCEECEDETLTFTWKIEAPATKYSGSLAFLIKFECTEGENILYQWNTAKYVGVNVLAGIDNGEEFVDKYSNVLEEWYNDLTKGADSIEELNQQAIAEIELAKEDAKEDIQGKADATMDEMNRFSSNAYNSFKNDVDEKAARTLETIPEEYMDLDADVKYTMNAVDKIVVGYITTSNNQKIKIDKINHLLIIEKSTHFVVRGGEANVEYVVNTGDGYSLNLSKNDLNVIIFNTTNNMIEVKPHNYNTTMKELYIASYWNGTLYTHNALSFEYTTNEMLESIEKLNQDLSNVVSENIKTLSLIKDIDVLISPTTVEYEFDFPLISGVSYEFSMSDYPDQDINFFYDNGRSEFWGGENRFTSTKKEFVYTPTKDVQTLYMTFYAEKKEYIIKIKRIDNINERVYKNSEDIAQIGAVLNGMSRWSGKKALFLGDSITIGSWNNPDSGWENMDTPFPYWVGTILDMTIVNYGIGGTHVSGAYNSTDGSQASNSFTNRYSQMDSDADLIVVMGGTNDWHPSHTDTAIFGTIEDTTDISFFGALNVLCSGLVKKYLGKQIVFMTPIANSNQSANPTTGKTLREYSEAIKNVCSKFSIPVIDCNAESPLHMNVVDFQAQYSSDGTHPNKEGQKMLGEFVARRLNII